MRDNVLEIPDVSGMMAEEQVDEALLVIERRKANLKIRQAEEILSSLEITAPHKCIVVFRKDWRGNLPQVGDMVWRGQSLAEIPALDEFRTIEATNQ